VAFELAPLRDAPPGGIVLRGPWPAGARVRVDGQRVVGDAREIALQAPARVRIDYPDDAPPNEAAHLGGRRPVGRAASPVWTSPNPPRPTP
jgi:hypothetical protein